MELTDSNFDKTLSSKSYDKVLTLFCDHEFDNDCVKVKDIWHSLAQLLATEDPRIAVTHIHL